MLKLYAALAEAFLAEGLDTQFVPMGEGNMHWSSPSPNWQLVNGHPFATG